jgi:broad specificity phosphatase PhoE
MARQGSTHRGAETRKKFLERAIVDLNEVLRQTDPVLMVPHGGLFRATKHYTGIDDSVQVKTTISSAWNHRNQLMPNGVARS